MHTVNSQKLKQLISGMGEFGWEKTVIGSGIAKSTLEKMCAGNYRHAVGYRVRRELCRFFSVSEAELFPEVRGGKRSA